MGITRHYDDCLHISVFGWKIQYIKYTHEFFLHSIVVVKHYNDTNILPLKRRPTQYHWIITQASLKVYFKNITHISLTKNGFTNDELYLAMGLVSNGVSAHEMTHTRVNIPWNLRQRSLWTCRNHHGNNPSQTLTNIFIKLRKLGFDQEESRYECYMAVVSLVFVLI